MYAERNGEKFNFRYDSGSWYYDAQFNEKGTELSLKTQTSFNLITYASFELPRESDSQQFHVYLNGEPKQFIQSMDELGNWHVSFIVKPFETGNLLITGFEKGWTPGENDRIPAWLKNNSLRWSEGNLDDVFFVKGLKFMANQKIIQIPESYTGEDVIIPNWVKVQVGWWAKEKIDDINFVQGIQFLIDRGIIRFN